LQLSTLVRNKQLRIPASATMWLYERKVLLSRSARSAAQLQR